MEMTRDFIIREAARDDFEAMFAIWCAGFDQAMGMAISGAELERHKAFMLGHFDEVNDTFKIWVAVDKAGTVIGWQSLLPYDTNPVARELSAEPSTYVHPDYHGRGIGQALMKHAMEHTHSTPLQYVLGYVVGDNDTQKRVVEKMGMQVVGRIPAPLKEPMCPPSWVYVYVVPKKSA